MENQVTTETNVHLTKEHKDKDITDKYNSLSNSGSVDCGQSVEFEELDGFLYENSNYKYQYEKQKISENKMEFECGDSDKMEFECGDSDNSNVVILIVLMW